MKKSFIVDDEGKPTSVVIDYAEFLKIESILLDYGLGKAMEEIEDEEEINLDQAKEITGFLKQKTS